MRNPGATRPWQHVLEPLSGYLELAAKLHSEPKKWSGAWNFGPSSNQVRTVKDVAEVIVNQLGQGSIKVDMSKLNVHEANLLQLNCDKAHQLLNWFPKWDVDQTLTLTASWYRDVINGANPEKITRSQVNKYFRK